MTLDRHAPPRKLAVMRFLICLLMMTGPVLADACTDSPRAFWSVACDAPAPRAIALEMEALISAIRDNPLQSPGTWAAHGLRAEMIYQTLNACLPQDLPVACLTSVAAGYIAELRESPQLPDGYTGLSRTPVDLLCLEYARPFRLTRLDTDPAMIWIAPGYALLERDLAARNVVYGGMGAAGTIDLGILPSGQVVLTGLSDRPMPCMIMDETALR